nr:hypothetical protein [uncultured Sphaerochaeta sp.]
MDTTILLALIGSPVIVKVLDHLFEWLKRRKQDPVQQMRSVVKEEITPLSNKVDALSVDIESLRGPVAFMGRAMPIVVRSQKSMVENGIASGWNHTSEESLEALDDLINESVANACATTRKGRNK